MEQKLWLVLMIISATVAIRLPSMEGNERRLHQSSTGAYETREDLYGTIEDSPPVNATFNNESAFSDNRCGVGTPTTTCPPVTPPPTPPAPTPPPCGSIPISGSYPTLPSITYTTNCDFCDHNLYTLTCIQTAFVCANLCAADWKCTHFTHITNTNGGTCILKNAPGSGGAWSTAIQPPSNYVCGYIPKRAFSNILLSICLGLDISLGHYQH